VASVVLAKSKGQARKLLDRALNNAGLLDSESAPYTLKEVNPRKSAAYVLCDGDY
jgi:hypothetical protein